MAKFKSNAAYSKWKSNEDFIMQKRIFVDLSIDLTAFQLIKSYFMSGCSAIMCILHILRWYF